MEAVLSYAFAGSLSVESVSGGTEHVDVLVHVHLLESVTCRSEILPGIEDGRLLVGRSS